jgi:uncharacterized protein
MRRVTQILAAGLLFGAASCSSSTPPSCTEGHGNGCARTGSSSAAGGVRQVSIGVGTPALLGTLTLPAGGGPFPAVVLVSGSGPNDQDETDGPNKPLRDIALGLAAHGVASLRYDKRTHDYPGSIQVSTFTPTQEYVPDALAAITLLQNHPGIDPHRIFVLGHSQGGTYAPLIAARAPSVAGVILLAASTGRTADNELRQARYLATLPGSIGTNAQQAIPALERLVAVVDNPTTLEDLLRQSPSTAIGSGTGAAYFLDELRYDEVGTASRIPQPLLILQGERDYQVPVAQFDVWLKGLAGRPKVSNEQFPQADHLFLDGTGRPTPAEYQQPGHVDPGVAAKIAMWIRSVHTS